MTPKVEKIAEGIVLGEGPHWDHETQSLYFVDVFGKTLNRYVPATGKHTQVSTEPHLPSFIIPVQGKSNHFVVPLDKTLTVISWDGASDKYTAVEKIVASPDNYAFNDAKCDSTGTLWAGTQNINVADIKTTKAVGSLYSLGKDKKLTSHIKDIKIANGLAWNEKIGKFYYIDSLKYVVDRYDYDAATGTLSNGQVWFTFTKHNVNGFPDGMAIDTEGNLWVAGFGAKKILKIDGQKAETLLDAVELPDIQVTSAAFGGKNLDELYVTTAVLSSSDLQFPAGLTGGTYRITGTGSKGFNGIPVKL